MIAAIYNAAGITGDILVLSAYFLLQIDKISAKKLTYLLLNLLGSSFIAFSLIFEWNLPSFAIESAWILISVYGIWKSLR